MRDIKSDTIQRMEINYHQNGGADVEVTPRSLDRVTAGPDDYAKGIRAVGSQRWRTVCKGWNKEEGFFKTTKAMEFPGCGVGVQMTTQQGDHVAEAGFFIAGAVVVPNPDGETVTVTHPFPGADYEPPTNRFEEKILQTRDIPTSDLLEIDKWLGRLRNLMGEPRHQLVHRAIQALAERHGVTAPDYLQRLDAEGMDDEEATDE